VHINRTKRIGWTDGVICEKVLRKVNGHMQVINVNCNTSTHNITEARIKQEKTKVNSCYMRHDRTENTCSTTEHKQ